MTVIAYALGDEGERIPLLEVARDVHGFGEVTIRAKSDVLSDWVTIVEVEWPDPFGVGYPLRTPHSTFPLTVGPGNDITIHQPFVISAPGGPLSEAERVRAIPNRYRAARAERIAPTPKVRDARAWKPYAEVYLPLAAVNLQGILESLPLDAEVRQSEVSDVLYIGVWVGPMEEVERQALIRAHVPPFDTLDSDNLERP